jgi:hypothetical protein
MPAQQLPGVTGKGRRPSRRAGNWPPRPGGSWPWPEIDAAADPAEAKVGSLAEHIRKVYL